MPVAGVIKASDKEQLQVCGAGWHDGRTVLGRRIKEALMPKTELVQMLVDLALNAGIPCDYVLMDTWFIYEPLMKAIRDKGLHVIGMLKQDRRKWYTSPQVADGTSSTLKQLMQSCFKDRRCKGNIYGTKICYTKTGFALKLVFVRSRSKQSEYIVNANTDLDLSDEESISLYARSFSIEGIFRGI